MYACMHMCIPVYWLCMHACMYLAMNVECLCLYACMYVVHSCTSVPYVYYYTPLSLHLTTQQQTNKQASDTMSPSHFWNNFIPALQALLYSSHLSHWYMAFPNLEFEHGAGLPVRPDPPPPLLDPSTHAG